MGAGFSWRLYRGPEFALADSLKSRFQGLFNVLENRYGFDDFYLWWVDLGDRLARLCHWVDDNIIDRFFVDAWGLVMMLLAEIQNFLDMLIVDGAVDGVGSVTGYSGRGLRVLMAGQVQEYLLYLALAVGVASLLVVMSIF